MTPTNFPQANTRFGPPPDLADSQCGTIYAYVGEIKRGSIEGSPVIVTAWKPSPSDLAALLRGEPVFLSFICNGLPPHMATTDFAAATNPA